MSLGNEQRRFTRLLADLVIYAYEIGYELTYGDAYRDKRMHGEVGEKKAYGHKNSCHKVRLAVDFNIFEDGKYLQGSEATFAHNRLHDYWDQLGGGKRIKHDLNHYSFEWQGMR